MSDRVIGVNHVQVNIPEDSLQRGRDFYIGFLGMREIPRPTTFASDGIWLNAGTFEIHIGLEKNIERLTRAHVAYEVTDILAWRKKVLAAGYEIGEQPKIAGYDRFHFRDPFGNNVELIERVANR